MRMRKCAHVVNADNMGPGCLGFPGGPRFAVATFELLLLDCEAIICFTEVHYKRRRKC